MVNAQLEDQEDRTMTRFPIPRSCPVCGGNLTVTRLDCVECDTRIEGRFDTGWPGRLSKEQLAFVEVFLRNRGIIKDVEVDLGLSYPTIRARLDDVVRAMGYGEPGEDRRGQRSNATARRDQRRQILEALKLGTISSEEAAIQMRDADSTVDQVTPNGKSER